MSPPSDRTAVIANHFQNENCHPRGRIKVGIADDSAWREQRLANAAALFAAARARGVPVIHVRLAVPPDYRGIAPNTAHIREWMALGAWREGSWGVAFVEGLEPAAGDHVLTHACNSAFQGTPLDAILRHLRRDHLICCGVSTAYTVETTVRHATDMGYHVGVVGDACSTATAEQHERALAAMAPLAEVTTLAELAWDRGEPT